MSTHTPGPWYVDGLAIQAGPHNNIGVVNLARASQADACLIAAAPELAEALQLFVSQWNVCGPNSDFGRHFQNVRDAAIAALAKAGL